MQWPILPTTAHELMELPQYPLVKVEIQVPDGGAWINICDYWGLGADKKKNYLMDVSFSTGGAKMSPDPIAGEFSVEIDNPGNIFHPNHPTSGAQGFFRAGRRVRISLGGRFTSGNNDWQRIIGFMDEPQFSSDTLKVSISGLDYMRRLSDMNFTKEVVGAAPGQLPTPIDNYWGNVWVTNSISTAGATGAEEYVETDVFNTKIAGAPPIETNATTAAPGSWAVVAPAGLTTLTPQAATSAPALSNWEAVFHADPPNSVATVENPNVCNIVAGNTYLVTFEYRRFQGLNGMGCYISVGGVTQKSIRNLQSDVWATGSFEFTATQAGAATMKFVIRYAPVFPGLTVFLIDNISIKQVTTSTWHKYDMTWTGCTGIYYVELDEGAGFLPVGPGKQGDPGEGWYYEDDGLNKYFYFDQDKTVANGTLNLRIYYYTTQQAQNVVADILVKAYPTVYVPVGPATRRDAALKAMQYPVTGVGIDRVWFDAGSPYIDAIRMLCERCNYRFYFAYDGTPRFVPAPAPAAVPIFTPFLPKHFQSPRIYQSQSEIWNRIVIEGEKVAELTGWQHNMPSELKAEAFNNVSILNYGTRTKSIKNHLFQNLLAITGMCATLLAAYKDPKWYLDFQTPYNAAPMEIGDTIQVEEFLELTLADIVHICLIRNMDISLYNVTYSCEIKIAD